MKRAGDYRLSPRDEDWDSRWWLVEEDEEQEEAEEEGEEPDVV